MYRENAFEAKNRHALNNCSCLSAATYLMNQGPPCSQLTINFGVRGFLYSLGIRQTAYNFALYPNWDLSFNWWGILVRHWILQSIHLQTKLSSLKIIELSAVRTFKYAAKQLRINYAVRV